MDFDSALTHAFSNTLMILVCIFVLLWFVKSMRRLYHAVNLRYYLMYDNVIEIAGLGSYLSYFDDASRAHLHAIVHTRQTKPPVQMDIAYVPLSLQHVHLLLNHDTHKRTLEIKFLTTTPGRLFLIPNLKIKKLKKSLQPQLRSLLLGGSAAAGSGSVAASQTISTEGVNKFTASSKQKQVINFIRRTVFNIPESVIAGAGGSKDGEEASQDLPWLCGQELCNTAKAPYVHCHPGLQVVKFNISEFFDKHRSNHVGNAADAELMELALVFVSTNSAKDMIISNIGTTYQAGPLSESTPRDTR